MNKEIKTKKQMGRPKGSGNNNIVDPVMLSVVIDRHIKEYLAITAEIENKTLSEMIRDLCKDKVKALEAYKSTIVIL